MILATNKKQSRFAHNKKQRNPAIGTLRGFCYAKNMEKPGTLFVVATPIGNMEDITLRASHVLREVDLVIAEDTRVTRKLLHHLGTQQETVRYDENISEERVRSILEPVMAGKDAAVVTDAGTPNVSDPGWKLVALASSFDIKVVPIPGPSALTTLISVTHFPLGSFVFEGFPPAKKGRQTFFKTLAEEARSVVLYESPHRIVKTLTALAEVAPERHVVVGKELTKLYEALWRGTCTEVAATFAELPKEKLKGEFVIALAPKKYGQK